MSSLAVGARQAWWNIVGLRRRLRTFAIAVAVAGGMTVAALTVGNAAVDTQRQQASAPALRSIEIDPAPPGGAHSVLTQADVTQLQAVAGVESVEPIVKTTIGIKTPPLMGVILYPITANQVSPPPITASVVKQVFPLSGNEIVVPSSTQNQDFRPLLGKTVPVTLTPDEGDHGGLAMSTAKVVALYDPSWQVDGEFAAYAAQDMLVDWAAVNQGMTKSQYLATTGYTSVVIEAMSTGAVDGVLAKIQGEGFQASSLLQIEQSLPGVLRLLHIVGDAAAIVLSCLLILLAAALAGSLTRERIKEFALLRAVGQVRGDILRLVLLEQLMLGGAAAVGMIVVALPATSALTALVSKWLSVGQYLPHGIVLPHWSVVAWTALAIIVVITASAVPAALRAARLEPLAGLYDI